MMQGINHDQNKSLSLRGYHELKNLTEEVQTELEEWAEILGSRPGYSPGKNDE